MSVTEVPGSRQAEVVEADAVMAAGLANDVRGFLNGKLVAAGNVLLTVRGIQEVDGSLVVNCAGGRNVFDAVRKAGLDPDEYRYERGTETFTVKLSVDQIAQAVAGSLGGESDAAGEGSEDFMPDPDPEATQG